MHLRALLVSALTILIGLFGATWAYAASYQLSEISLPDGTVRTPRWDPCQPAITYKVNVKKVRGAAAKRSAIQATKVSVARVADATGMRFSYQGRTDRIPRSGSLSSQNTAEIVIAFVRPSDTDYDLRGATVGQGGWTANYMRVAGSYVAAISRGFVVIDEPQTRNWPNGTNARGVTRTNLITHELGHAVGMGHSTHADNLMYPALQSRTPPGFAREDQQGLTRVGRAAGCIDITGLFQDL